MTRQEMINTLQESGRIYLLIKRSNVYKKIAKVKGGNTDEI